jgi:hypothetical protein
LTARTSSANSGRPECSNLDLARLTREERIAYAKSQRSFTLSTNAAKIKVQ